MRASMLSSSLFLDTGLTVISYKFVSTLLTSSQMSAGFFDVVNGSYTYRGKMFDFVDYLSFCCSLCAILNDEDFLVVLNNVANFVQDMHVSMKTKAGWNEFFTKITNHSPN